MIKKLLAIFFIAFFAAVSAFSQMVAGLSNFSTIRGNMDVESTGIGDDGAGLVFGGTYETNLGQNLLVRAGTGFTMAFTKLWGFYGEAGGSLILFSRHGMAEWHEKGMEQVGRDTYNLFTISGTTKTNLIATLDVGGRIIALWGGYEGYGSGGLNAYAVGGPRFFSVYDLFLPTTETMSIYAYGVAGYAEANYLVHSWEDPTIVPGHVYYGALIGVQWWWFEAELRYLDSQFQFKAGMSFPLSWMPE